MEFTQEQIDSLSVNEVEILRKIASELGIQTAQVSAVVSLLAEGCTVPFIARYRKEKHGSLDEVQVRSCEHLFKSLTNLESRRLEILRGIFAQGKLTESLFDSVSRAATLTELEDLWAPFKKKKKTRGMLAAEKGLEPLADFMLENDAGAVEAEAASFIRTDAENPELSVPSAAEAIQGAKDILAERFAQNPENRQAVRGFYLATGNFAVSGVGDAEKQKTSVYQMYWDYKEPLKQIKPHRILAINRGEREGQLDVKIDVDTDGALRILEDRILPRNHFVREAAEDGLVRLLSPAILREIRGDLSENADEHGITVFSENLKNLLMTQPIKRTRVLGVDPGIRTGTKCAALDENGKYLGSFVVYQHKADEAKAAFSAAMKKYGVQLVAVGGGTGTKEVQEIVSQVIQERCPDISYTVVDEDGASVYSASDVAREEFPDLDLTIRGAISIGRRLQDPLAELVKIDPKSIGVGLYQHDVNQKKLSETLDEVVGSVVNRVGVNVNTASASLLKYVSGINGMLAKKIVSYRNETGPIASRAALMQIPGMGPKTFEQCAGFLKIPESPEPLDSTWVHPENYAAGRAVYELLHSLAGADGTLPDSIGREAREDLKSRFSLGDETIQDIISDLRKPNRDPRDDYPKPVMQKGVLSFEDLKEGMKVTGKIKNVVDFGAFVDIGIKETALLHLSEMSDCFVSDPMEVVKVGDVKECVILALDPDRRRISLSCKTGARSGKVKSAAHPDSPERPRTDGAAPAGKRRVVVARRPGVSAAGGTAHAAGGSGPRRMPGNRDNRDGGDGMTYNPFAELLKGRK